MDDQEVELLRSTFEHVLTTTPARDLPGALLENGWAELLADDRHAAVASLFTVQGRTRAATAALDLVVLDALGLPVGGDVAVVYPPPSGVLAPGAGCRAGDTAVVDGLALAGTERAGRFVVAVGTDDGLILLTVASEAVTATPIGGFDPTLGLVRVGGSVPLDGAAPLDAATWDRAVAAARHALAHELLGAAEAIFAITVDHVQNRVQFGRALGSRQSVKHRVADVVVAIEGTRSVLDAFDHAPTPLMAAATKALAGRAALLAATHGQQLCGAIGFTVEHPMPGRVARAHLLDTLLGSAALLAGTLGDAVLAGHLERPYPISPAALPQS